MKIDVVIVTFNRLEKLRHTLSCYEKQTVGFRNLIVVDNHSNDGTVEYLNEWKTSQSERFSKHVLFLDENTGGSGGFYAGQKYAMDLNPDWVYLSDDDAYPDPDVIEKFICVINNNKAKKIAAICATVYGPSGNIDIAHRGRIHLKKLGFKLHREHVDESVYASNTPFNIDLLSYVGSLVNAKAMISVGLVNPKLFIYCDDTEHSLRLRKFGEILCCPHIKVLHDWAHMQQRSNEKVIVTWRDYYDVRNNMLMSLRHFKLFALYQASYILCRYIWKLPKEKRIVYVNAIKDAWLNRQGKHTLYKPGWQIISK